MQNLTPMKRKKQNLAKENTTRKNAFLTCTTSRKKKKSELRYFLPKLRNVYTINERKGKNPYLSSDKPKAKFSLFWVISQINYSSPSLLRTSPGLLSVILFPSSQLGVALFATKESSALTRNRRRPPSVSYRLTR